MAQKYKSIWTGPQVDAAVDQVADKIDRSEIGVAGGVASLGDDGKVPSYQLPQTKSVSADDFIGTDGITIDKAADSEKIEISGSGCVQKDTTRANVVYGHTYDLAPQMFYVSQNNGNSNWLAKYDTDGESGAKEPVGKGRLSSREPIQPYQLANKKYVDDNFVKKISQAQYPGNRIYGTNNNGDTQYSLNNSNEASNQAIPKRDVGGSLYIPDSSIGRSDYNFTSGQEAVNKNYVDNAVANANPQTFKTLFGNQSIVGTGNIDLYKHHVKFEYTTSAGFVYTYYTDIWSSMSFSIDSLTDLKTYLGSTFIKDLYGYGVSSAGKLQYPGLAISENYIIYWGATGDISQLGISSFTISDTITTI